MRLKDFNEEDLEEIDIFEDSDWDFLEDDDSSDYGFFEDVEDYGLEDFEIITPAQKIATTVAYTVIGGVMVVSIVYFSHMMFAKDHSQAMLDDMSVNLNTDTRIVSTVEYRIGEAVTPEEFVEASSSITGYMKVIRNKGGFSKLENHVFEYSHLREEEKVLRESMKHSFDSNDAYSRALILFSSMIEVERVNKVVKTDEGYFAYVNVVEPDVKNIKDYFTRNSSYVTQHFTKNPLTNMEVSRFLLDFSKSNGLPMLEREIELELEKVGDEYRIADDYYFYDVSSETYTVGVSSIIEILGGNK